MGIMLRSPLFLALLMAGVMLLGASAAFAADVSAASFSCSGGKANGALYVVAASCPTTLTTDNFFSFLICNMEQLASNVMGAMYCGIIQSLTPIVWAAATLSITLFGVMFMTGIIQVERGAAALFVIKIAFVTGLALNADLLIGVIYRFLITVAHDGAAVALSAVTPGTSSAASLYTQVDAVMASAFGMATDMLKGSLSSDPTLADERCKNAVFAVMATMFAIAPTIGYLGLLLIARLAMGMFSAVFGYLYALIGITFLTILAPFFLCFYLFKQTQPFFDKWISYLVSFVLQAVLLFAFLSFVLSIKVSSIAESLPGLFMYQSQTVETQSLRMPWQYCTLCDFKAVDKDSGADIAYDAGNFGRQAKLVCINHSSNPAAADSQGRIPLLATYAMAPTTSSGSGASSSTQISALLAVGGSSLIALITLAALVSHLLKLVPGLAQKLASGMGAVGAPQLGGGVSHYNAPTAALPGDGLRSDFRAGFEHGYGKNMGNNTISATVQGVKEGFAVMLTGNRTDGAPGNSTSNQPTGSIRRGLDWLSDPAKLD